MNTARVGGRAAATTRRPSVLHVGKFYPPHRGGMETHLETLSRRLCDDVDVSVVVANDSGPTVREPVNGIDVTRLRSVASFRSTPICPGMARAIRNARADIVHLHWPNPAAVLSYMRSGHEGPLVVTYHSDVVRQRMLGSLFLPILHRFLRRSSAIICTSPDYMRSSSVLARHIERCRVLPFSISQEPFVHADTAATGSIRARYGPRIVLAAGRLVTYKGFVHLVRAMASIDAHLILIGTGPLHGQLQSLRHRLNLEDRVDILGAVPDLIPYYHAADVFVLPSITRAEAFGLVQLEAMACGKPVVNTALGTGTTHVSQDGVTGITVPPADPAALAAAINRLLASPELASRLGAAGRDRVAQEFNLERMGRETVGLYRELL